MFESRRKKLGLVMNLEASADYIFHFDIPNHLRDSNTRVLCCVEQKWRLCFGARGDHAELGDGRSSEELDRALNLGGGHEVRWEALRKTPGLRIERLFILIHGRWVLVLLRQCHLYDGTRSQDGCHR